MASRLQILPEGDRFENTERDAFSLAVSGAVYLAAAGVFYVGGSVQWAEMSAVFGLMNWVLGLVRRT
jgi:hypothetical protein